MSKINKTQILIKANLHIKQTQTNLINKIRDVLKKIENLEKEVKGDSRGDALVKIKLINILQERIKQLDSLKPSPYFFRCVVIFDDKPNKVKTLYFAKFSFSEKAIFSWTAKATVIRFENPGNFSYLLSDNTLRTGKLLRKDQFMIVKGKIIFMASESTKYERTLIYQEKLQRHKTQFVLPEIVELMEKNQDKVIRADYRLSFLISGPAGSGKTTLALHRVAYLLQAPDTQSLFPAHQIIVFVQDDSSKKYFQHLLDDLGASDIEIITFAEWVSDVLGLKKYKFVEKYGISEPEKDHYEYNKAQALKGYLYIKFNQNFYKLLETAYKKYFTGEQLIMLQTQKKEKVFDRFDLTLLLKLHIQDNDGLIIDAINYQQLKNQSIRKRIIKTKLNYSLIIIDEIQNYIPDQVKLIKSLIDEKTHALVYVGDLAQQTHLCTINSWQEIGESFNDERMVKLSKVYRNTKNILKYIKSVGYKVTIPQTLEAGDLVVEKIFNSQKEEINFAETIITENKKYLIGILAKQEEYLIEFKSKFKDFKNVKIMTINEAQGVEFDIVILVGVNKDFFKLHKTYSPKLLKERQKINKDLLYVALTRAMNKLYVTGKDNLKDIVKNF